MSTLEQLFTSRGIDLRISDVILEFARTHTVVTCITDVDNFRLSVAPDAYAAVYPSPSWMDVALSPEDARAAERKHGLQVTKSNDTTAYLRIPADHLDDEVGRRTTLELLDVAWDKAFRGPRWELGLGPHSKSTAELCEVHFIEKPLSGECLLCE